MADPLHRVDVAVVGGGPAGRAITSRAASHGLTTAVIDPAPRRRWPATYGMWLDELPDWLPTSVVAAIVDGPTATARTQHMLARPYAVLDTGALQDLLSAEDGTVEVAAAAVGTRPDGDRTAVLLEGGAALRARVVVDASGARRTLSAMPAAGSRATQTAFGIVVPDDGRHPHSFMDWTADHGEPGWPSFLYAVPLGPGADGSGRLLLEETSLARRPGLDVAVLRRRLHWRMGARGVEVPADADTEVVAFPVDIPPTTGVGAVVPFGVAAGRMHPATGYSVGTSLDLADPFVAAIAAALHASPRDGRGAAEAARQTIWPAQARLVHHLRRRGLEVLLALPAEGVVDFFELFFDLPHHHQRAYLSERHDLPAVTAAMWAVFSAADRPLKRHLARWGLPPIGDHHAGP